MDVAVCLLTRNHAGTIGRAVASCRALPGRILVADTGSTDDTLAAARAAGADTATIPWSDDFAAACNAVLERADCEWVLWINPDEELLDPAPLAAAVAEPDTFAFHLNVRQKLRPDGDAGTTGRELRLYRRDPRVRYVGRVHPQFETALETIAHARSQSVRSLDATILRHAYLSTPTPDKIRWVVRLLEAELRDRPERLSAIIELGRNLLWLNDPRGHDLLATAAARVRPLLDQPHAPDPAVGQLFEYLLNADPAQVRTELSLQQVHSRVVTWFLRTPPVLWAAAQERYRAKDYHTAARYLDTLLEIGSSGWYDSPGFDPDIVGIAAAMALGACYLLLENWMMARACFEHYVHDPRHGAMARRGYAEADAKWRASIKVQKS